MGCGCESLRRVPIRDTGIWNTETLGRKQQTRIAYAQESMKPHPMLGGNTRSERFIFGDANINIGEPRASLPRERPRNSGAIGLLLIGGLAWLAIRGS